MMSVLYRSLAEAFDITESGSLFPMVDSNATLYVWGECSTYRRTEICESRSKWRVCDGHQQPVVSENGTCAVIFHGVFHGIILVSHPAVEGSSEFKKPLPTFPDNPTRVALAGWMADPGGRSEIGPSKMWPKVSGEARAETRRDTSRQTLLSTPQISLSTRVCTKRRLFWETTRRHVSSPQRGRDHGRA